MTANLLALGAIALWASLAALGVSLTHVPPFLLTGLALLIGSLIALPLSRFDVRQWRVPTSTLALGVYGLFGFHFLLFIALRHAPPVQANLVNYLWPLLIVVLAPAIVPGIAFSMRHGLAALLGFSGAALLIGSGAGHLGEGAALGYAFAAASALIWSTYSLLTRRMRHFPTGYVAWFCLASGAASLACHAAFEPRYAPLPLEWLGIAALGVGPMGAAFFLWDRAMKVGDPRAIGNLAYLTPLLSTLALVAIGAGSLTGASVAAMGLIVSGAWLGR